MVPLSLWISKEVVLIIAFVCTIVIDESNSDPSFDSHNFWIRFSIVINWIFDMIAYICALKLIKKYRIENNMS